VRRLTAVLVLAVAVALAAAAGSPAATLKQSYSSYFDNGDLVVNSSLAYTGSPGEYNRVGVFKVDNYVNWFDRLAPIVVDADPITSPVQPVNSPTTWGCDSVTKNDAVCAFFQGYNCVVNPMCQVRTIPGFAPITIDTADADDIVYAQDGAAERITCGSGADEAHVDATDTVADDCEVVVRG
jgi:hypothetical protein